MEFRQLRQFLAVAEEGSFTAAAARLHMAQSPLSQAVRALERDLGTPLFDRSHRRITLTPAGRTLQHEAREILRRVERARRAVQQVEPGWPVVVAALSDLPPRLLERTAEVLAAGGTDVRLDLIEGTSRRNPHDVLRGRAAVGLTREPDAPDGLLQVHLGDEEFGAVVPASHPFARREEPLTPDDLAVFGRWLGFPRQHSPRWFDKIAELAVCCGLTVDTSAETDTRDFKIDKIVLGCGVSFAPRWSADRLVSTGTVWKPLAGAPLHRRTSAVRCPPSGAGDDPVALVLDAMGIAWPA